MGGIRQTKDEPSLRRGRSRLRSCARHNGMTGAGSDRDAGPTPVQRARFRRLSPEASKSQDLLATTGAYPGGTPGRQRSAMGYGVGDGSLPAPHALLSPSTVSLHARVSSPGCSIFCPLQVRQKTALQHACRAVHQTTTHEGLIETCRSITGHAEDPSRTARENGQKVRFPGMAHGRSIREPRLSRDLQATRWG